MSVPTINQDDFVKVKKFFISGDYRAVLIFVISLFVIFQFVNIVSRFLLFDRTSYELPAGLNIPLRAIFLPWLNFDGRNYLTIVTEGYSSNQTLAAFYPFYPMTIKFISSTFGINPIALGLTISFFSTLSATLLLYRLIKHDFNSKIANRSLILLLIFPSSFYLFAYYTESIFLLLSVMVFWFLRRKNILSASIFAAIATLTRVVGLALIPVIVYECIYVYKKTGRIAWEGIVSFAGIAGYMLFSYLRWTDPLFVIHAHSDPRFGRTIGILSPIIGFKDAIAKVAIGPQSSYDTPFVYPVIVLELIVALFAIGLLVLSYKKIPAKYWLYCFFSVTLIMFGGAFSASVRHLLLVFPFFVFLGKYLPKRYYLLFTLISVGLLIFSSSLFLRNYWIA